MRLFTLMKLSDIEKFIHLFAVLTVPARALIQCTSMTKNYLAA